MKKTDIAYLSCKILSLLGIYFALGYGGFILQFHLSITSERFEIAQFLIRLIPVFLYLSISIFLWINSEKIANKIFIFDNNIESDDKKNIKNIIDNESIIILAFFIIGISILASSIANILSTTANILWFCDEFTQSQVYINNYYIQLFNAIISFIISIFFIFFPRKIIIIINSIKSKIESVENQNLN